MNARISFFGFVLIASALIVSCYKSNEKPPSTEASPENMRKLSGGAWVYEVGGLDLDRNGIGDIELPVGFAQACQLDNQYRFANNYTGTIFDSTLRCDTTVPDGRTFNWWMSDNEQFINFRNGDFLGLTGKFRLWWLTDSFMAIARDTLVRLPQIPQPVSASALFLYKKRS